MNTSQLTIKTLCEIVLDLQERVAKLEDENVGTTNELYELQNRLDILNEPRYNHLKNFKLET
jgi:hypothetical protein